MRNYEHIDGYINKLYGDLYPQPQDEGHTALATKVINHWLGRMTTCHSVLDVGCGEGFCQYAFERQNVTYEGIALGEDVDVAHSKGRNVKKMDFSFLDYPDNSFDLIFARHALEHSPMPLITLMEWRRVAKNWLGIILPHPDWYTYTGKNHYSVMNLDQIRNILDVAGWNIMWEEVDMLPFNQEGEMKAHEIWLMSEKKRG